MERGIERYLGIRNFSLINLVYWLLAVLIIHLGSIRSVESSIFADRITDLLISPIAPWLSYWALGYLAVQARILLHRSKRIRKWISLSLVTLSLGLLHSFLTPVISLLLVRLFTSYQLDWSQVFMNPFELPQYLILSIILFLIFFGLIEFLGNYRRSSEKNQRSDDLLNELSNAQLKNLKMQMRPHFLFNALNTIAMMVRDDRRNEATEMISDLSDMLRASLKDSDSEFSSVADEINLVKKLLSIEKYRFEDRLSISVEVESEAEQCIIPVLIFQPLVENAFKHGVAKTIGEALVSINCYVKDEQLYLEVFNTGPNLPDNWELQKSQNIGLANTSARLARIYGSRSKLIIEEKNDGILITIRLPVKR